MKTIGLLRHGATPYTNRYIGSSEVELSAEGIAQVRRQHGFLAAQGYDTIFCSPMKRCVQTYSLLRFPQECIVDERLREIDFGAWEGRSFEEIARLSPNLVEQWSRNSDDFGFPGGEKLGDFRGRVHSFCELLRKLADQKILIIAHGGIIRYMICCLLGLPIHNYLYFKVDTARLCTLRLYSEGAVLTGLNSGKEDG